MTERPPEIVPFLRLARFDLRADVIAAAPGFSNLLRLVAAEIDGATHADVDMLVLAGISLELLGGWLRDEALAVRV